MLGVTVAVKVTDCPATAGFSDDVSIKLVGALLMDSENPAEILGRYKPFPA
jgi:hypothetical protein